MVNAKRANLRHLAKYIPVKEIDYNSIILGSVFNDYVVFYRDIGLILLWAMRVQIRYFWLFLAHVFYNYNLAFNLIFVVLEHWLIQH